MKDKETEGCTFQPNTEWKKEANQKKRNLNEFLDDQAKFQENVKKKKEMIGSQIDPLNQTTKNPALCEESMKLLEDKEDRKTQPTY